MAYKVPKLQAENARLRQEIRDLRRSLSTARAVKRQIRPPSYSEFQSTALTNPTLTSTQQMLTDRQPPSFMNLDVSYQLSKSPFLNTALIQDTFEEYYDKSDADSEQKEGSSREQRLIKDLENLEKENFKLKMRISRNAKRKGTKRSNKSPLAATQRAKTPVNVRKSVSTRHLPKCNHCLKCY